MSFEKRTIAPYKPALSSMILNGMYNMIQPTLHHRDDLKHMDGVTFNVGAMPFVPVQRK